MQVLELAHPLRGSPWSCRAFGETETTLICRRIFSKAGYRVALIARRAEGIQNTAKEIKESGGEVSALPFNSFAGSTVITQALPLHVSSYSYASFTDAFKKIRSEWPDSPIRVAVFNAAANYRKPFLEVKEEEIKDSLETNVVAAFGFSREAILAFKEQTDNELGKKGTLIFTGATAAIRGNKTTSAFAAGKFGVRSLSQSLAKEFGPQGVHVSHVRFPLSANATVAHFLE
jgi:NAD(P)-dependent dehydrogenase (short-subunit alcohol dehydrogenase family)